MGGAGGTSGNGGTGGGGAGGAAGATGGAGGMGGNGGNAGTGMDPDEDGGVEPDGGDEPRPDLPDDGNELSVCESTDDCNGDDLACVQYEAFQGYCAEDCSETTDCGDVGGLTATCEDDRCVIDCSAEGSDGDCPANMECAEITTTPISDPIFRCQYPEPKDGKIYEACEYERGDADCSGDLVCHMFPGLTDPRVAICAAGCMEATDCDDLGSDATPVCDPAPLSPFDGICALACEADEDCPADMACADVDLVLSRCIFE